MFTDSSYFIGPLTLAQLGQPTVVAKLNDVIEMFEPELLQAALGYELYTDFIAGLNPGSDETIEQKWLDLRDGIEFTTLYDVKAKWIGFKGTNKKIYNPVTAFIYYKVVQDLTTQITGVGVAQATAENSVPANPAQKMTYAYNSMVENIWLLWEFLRANQDVYPQFNWYNINGMRLWNFFPYYRATGGKITFQKINSLGI